MSGAEILGGLEIFGIVAGAINIVTTIVKGVTEFVALQAQKVLLKKEIQFILIDIMATTGVKNSAQCMFCFKELSRGRNKISIKNNPVIDKIQLDEKIWRSADINKDGYIGMDEWTIFWLEIEKKLNDCSYCKKPANRQCCYNCMKPVCNSHKSRISSEYICIDCKKRYDVPTLTKLIAEKKNPQTLEEASSTPQANPQPVLTSAPQQQIQRTPAPQQQIQYNPPPQQQIPYTPAPQQQIQYNPPPQQQIQHTPAPQQQMQYNPPQQYTPTPQQTQYNPVVNNANKPSYACYGSIPIQSSVGNSTPPTQSNFNTTTSGGKPSYMQGF